MLFRSDFVSYGAPDTGAQVSIVGVDGKPPAEPHGPVELAPGNHTITLACNGANTPHTLKFAAGEVYQFLARQLPGKGCVATLARVRATNP
mgnify:CR=1 FL=1